MSRLAAGTVALLVILAACDDLSPGAGQIPPQPPVNGPLASLTPSPTPACTHHWAAPVNGSWDDATKWSPNSAPGAGSVVCIDAAGTYKVTLARNPGDPAVAISALAVGGASGVATLADNAADVTVTQGVNVAATGAIDFSSFNAFTFSAGGVFTNDGALTSGVGFGEGHVSIDADLLNRGTFTNGHNGSVSFVNHTVVNQGTMDFSNRVTSISGSGAVFEQQSGVLTGTGLSAFTVSSGIFRYIGGQIDAAAAAVQSTFGGVAVVRLTGANLELQTASAAPAVYLDWNPPAGPFPSLTGDIGANIHLRLLDNQGTVGFTFKGTLTNFGLLESNSVNQPTIDPEVLFVNRGTLSVTSNLHMNAPFENRATLSFTGQNGIFFSDPAGGYDNYGTMALGSGALYVTSGATLRIRPGSSLTSTGNITMDNGLLTGSGTVAITTVNLVNGGTIDPGLPVGSLTVGTIASPDQSGKLRFDINGGVPGTLYDQLTSAGFLTPGLNLIINTGPLPQACGIAADIITFATPGAFGSWASTTGLNPTPAIRWTPNATSTVYTLYGSNPASPANIAPTALSLAEGGPSGAYFMCLSQAPTFAVAITPAADAQETVPGGAQLFTTTNWFMPHAISVTAVDDAVAQGTHTGTITNAIASSDPSFGGLTLPSVVATIADNDVGSPNQNPVATNDAASTPQGVPVTIDVLANDTDPNGDPLTVASVTQGTHGAVTISSGKILYAPNILFPSGSDSFTYTIDDGHGGSATGSVAVTITPVVIQVPPMANPDVATTPQGTPVTISVLANDTDGNGDPLSIGNVGQPAPGTGTVTILPGNQQLRYTPAPGFTGIAVFSYTVIDGQGGFSPGGVTVTVTPVLRNRPPVAVADQVSAPGNVVTQVDVLANDTDPDGDALSITSVVQPHHGRTWIVRSMIRYLPNTGYMGGDEFRYTIGDGRGGTATAVVHVTVTRPPQLADLLVSNQTLGKGNATLGSSSGHLFFNAYAVNAGPALLPAGLVDFDLSYPAAEVQLLQPLTAGCATAGPGLVHCQMNSNLCPIFINGWQSYCALFGGRQPNQQDVDMFLEFVPIGSVHHPAPWTVKISAPFPDPNLANNTNTRIFDVGNLPAFACDITSPNPAIAPVLCGNHLMGGGVQMNGPMVGRILK